MSNDSVMGYLSGPALAIDKLEITYGKTSNMVNISPENENGFLKVLLARNSNIKVDKNIAY